MTTDFRLNMRLLFSLLCLVFCLLFACDLLADNRRQKNDFAELKAQYLKLRNTDIELVRAGEWKSLAEKFELFVDKNPSFSEAPFGLLNSSILYEQLYRKFGGQDRLFKSCGLLERLARDYPGHSIADDALLRRGDLYLYDLQDVNEARRSYLEIAQAYPDSDMADAAAARLREIKDGNYKQKSSQEDLTLPTAEQTRQNQLVPLVLIDPGHGGEDFGAVGPGGLLEKDVVLDIAFELEKLLKEKTDVSIRLTRRKDVFLPLAERTALANDFQADVFISLHVNADQSKKASGLEIYYLDNAHDQASKQLAERENASVQFEGAEGDLYFMLSDLIQNAKLDDSIILANTLNQSIYRQIKSGWKDIKTRGVKKAPFYVLVGAHMPCVVAELFFITNPRDGANLSRKKFRQDLAEGIFIGLQEFLRLHHEGD